MGTHSYLSVGKQTFFWVRESYIPELASIFKDDELSAAESSPTYSLSASKMGQRLNVLGFSVSAAQHAIASTFESVIHDDNFEGTKEPFESWVEEARRVINTDAELREVPEWVAWLVDPRALLRLLVDLVPSDSDVTYELGDVVSEGYVRFSSSFCADAFSELKVRSSFSPLIVLTEGKTDAEFLSAGVKILMPHLVDYIRFPDYELKPEGGASALVRAIRSFAAAGVGNQVLGLFDNDSAAAEAMTTLEVSRLPPNFKIHQLPRLSIADNYPTLGPNGLVEMDVNGLAVSIEMFLGEDILRIDGSSLSPVQWRGYITKVGSYQGEVMNKPSLHDAFRARAQEALATGTIVGDWQPMMELLEFVITVFD